MQVEVPIHLPSQLEDEIRKTIASVIIDGAKQATNLYYDLPPYPNKSQLKAALKVGNEKVKQWEAEGERNKEGDEDMKIVWLSLYFYLCFCFGELLWVLNF